MTCPSCKSEIEVSSRGQTLARKDSAANSSSSAPSPAPAPPLVVAAPPPAPARAPAQRGRKRSAPSAVASSASSPAKAVKKSGGKVVSVCGQLYASLSWFLNKDSPSATQCARARTRCSSSAVVLSGGHTRAVAEYAAHAGQTPRPLCMVDGVVRKRLGSVAVPTGVENITILRAPDTSMFHPVEFIHCTKSGYSGFPRQLIFQASHHKIDSVLITL